MPTVYKYHPNDILGEITRRELVKRKPKQEPTPIWIPRSEPQRLAIETDADELFYGGAAGGGKTDLLLGLAGTKHTHSIIFRRVFPSMRNIIERSREIYNSAGETHSKDSYNEQLHIWRLGSGKIIEFGAMQHEKTKFDYKGRPHDFYGWDELPEFTEGQYRFVNGWNRSTKPGQRCRVVATGNPPTTPEGQWVLQYWAPWLDPQHPNPAKPGELRWFATIDGKDQELPDGKPFEYNGELIQPRSRTFIPAKVTDNPYWEGTNYKSVLQSMPEPLRSQMLYGDFSIGLQDDPWQVIPTAWVLAAQQRWKQAEQPTDRLTAIGVDVARGGSDSTVIIKRYGNWFSDPIKFQGESTSNGQKVAGQVLTHCEKFTAVNVDVIGVGASVYDWLSDSGKVSANAINSASSSDATDKSGKLTFTNLRAEMLWKLREALDPEHGEGLMLPPGNEVVADLCSAHWEFRRGGVQIESKEEIKKRIGRSPDVGDAIALAFYFKPNVVFRSTTGGTRTTPAPPTHQPLPAPPIMPGMPQRTPQRPYTPPGYKRVGG